MTKDKNGVHMDNQVEIDLAPCHGKTSPKSPDNPRMGVTSYRPVPHYSSEAATVEA